MGISGINNSIYYDPYLYGSQSAQTSQGTQYSQNAQTSQGTQNSQNTQTSQGMQNSQNARTSQGMQNSQSIQASGLQNSQNTQSAETTDGKTVVNPGQSEVKLPGRQSSPAECQTCKNRKYQDGSDENNVSFKSAQHVDPASAFSAVSAHESEHVSNAYNKAERSNGEVVQASVAIHTAICPECGRVYVSGGTTTTQIKYPNESNPYQQSRKSSDAAGSLLGMNFNAAV